MENDGLLLYRKHLCGSSRKMLSERCWEHNNTGMKILAFPVGAVEYPFSVAYQIPAFYFDILVVSVINLYKKIK